MAALALLDAAQEDSCRNTLHSTASPSRAIRNNSSASRVASLIQERVQEMIRRDITFVLLWHVQGAEAVHVDTIPVLEDGGWDVYLSQFLSEELHECLRSL